MGIYNLGGGGGAPELQAKEATPLITNAQQIILPDEGYDGLSKVTVNPMPTGALKTPTVNSIGYVSSGVQTAGYLGTSATSGLQLSTQSAKTITPTTYSQTAVASGKYTTGAVTVAGDSDLVASNIKSGVNIFGVNGNYSGSPTIYTKGTTETVTSENLTIQFLATGNLNFYYSTHKLISFIVRYGGGESLAYNEITQMEWSAYAVPEILESSNAPIAMGYTRLTFTYYQAFNGNVAGANCQVDVRNGRIGIKLASSQGERWHSNGYEIYAWFAENPQNIS